MIDFIKFNISNKDEFDLRLQQEGEIFLSTRYDINTGELHDYPKSGSYYRMDLKLTEKSTYIKGSLHKLYNCYNKHGDQNYSDFHICQVWETLDIMCRELGINPELTKITNLEFGLNIQLNFDPQIFLDRNLIMFNFKDHSRNEKFGNKGDFKEFKRSDYSMKLYNKTKHFQELNPPQNLLRVEVKIIKSRVLAQLGIYSVMDLYHPDTYLRLMNFLMERFKKLIILDTAVMESVFREGDLDFFKDFTNPNYWIDLENRYKGDKNKLYKKRLGCIKTIEKLELDTTKKLVEGLLWEKFDSLTDCYKDSLYKVA